MGKSNKTQEKRADPNAADVILYTKDEMLDWYGMKDGVRFWEMAAELRTDPFDGKMYTRYEFMCYYGAAKGAKEFDRSSGQAKTSQPGRSKRIEEQRDSADSKTEVILKLAVPQKMWGRLCGAGGSRLQELEHEYDVQIRIPWRKARGAGEDKDQAPTVDVQGSRAAAIAAQGAIKRCAGKNVACVEEINVSERDAARDADEATASAELFEELQELLKGLPCREEVCETMRASVWGHIVEVIAPSLDDNASFQQKSCVASELQRMIRGCDHPRALVFLFGSSITGLAERSADLDICCDINGDGRSPPPDESKIVESVMRKLKDRYQIKKIQCVPNARVPIVTHKPAKEDLTLGIHGVKFDLSFRLLGAVNSRLIRHYVTGNPAVRIAAVAIKTWSKHVGITDSRNGYLTSYAVVIMLIYYCLRRERVKWLAPLSIRLVDCESLPPAVDNIATDNVKFRQDVGLLLGGFWHFYACEFDWDLEVVSVNETSGGNAWVGRTEKSTMGWDRTPAKDRQKTLGRYNCACIADPYELRGPGEPGFNLARHLSPVKTAEVRLRFAKAWAAFTRVDAQKTADEFAALLKNS